MPNQAGVEYVEKIDRIDSKLDSIGIDVAVIKNQLVTLNGRVGKSEVINDAVTARVTALERLVDQGRGMWRVIAFAAGATGLLSGGALTWLVQQAMKK